MWGPFVREGVVGRSVNRVWEGLCAVLCRCLHDAIGGHKMVLCESGWRLRDAQSALERQCGFNFIIIFVDFTFVE